MASFVRDLAHRPNPRGKTAPGANSKAGPANATLRQRLTAVRLYYDYLIEEGLRDTNPVGRGRYTANKGFGGQRERSLIPSYRKLPWIPTDDEWLAIVEAARSESLRNRLMLTLAYDAGLRREELCALETSDFDPAQRLLRIRAETTKNRQGRVVPYSTTSADLYTAYLSHRRKLTRARGPLFLSESRRNPTRPLTIWTWSKVVQSLALRANVPRLTTHTMRHLCLTDLARAGWEIHEIALFAGHRNTETTLTYIHLSGRDLAKKFARDMATIHLMMREIHRRRMTYWGWSLAEWRETLGADYESFCGRHHAATQIKLQVMAVGYLCCVVRLVCRKLMRKGRSRAIAPDRPSPRSSITPGNQCRSGI